MKMLPKLSLNALSLPVLFFMVVNARHIDNNKKSEFKETDYVFFNYNNLRVGAKMPIYFGGAFDSDYPDFLPKEKADMIPLSSQKLPFLLNYFGFTSDSPQAKVIEYSLKKCETEIHGEGSKKCVASLEDMIDYVRETFKMGTNAKNKLFDDLKVLSTSPLPKSTPVFQSYTIVKQPKRVPSPKMIACHMMTYPYALYFCHYPDLENRVYELSLVGEDGTHVNAVASCHMNTEDFDPNLVVFRMFGTKPGNPVCHFLSSDGLLWVPAHAQTKVVNVINGEKNIVNGEKNMGEYWGVKAIETLAEPKLNANSLVKDFVPKPSLQWLNRAANPTEDGGAATKYFVKDFEVKPNLQWLNRAANNQDDGVTTSTHFVRDFKLRPNLQWLNIAANDGVTAKKYFVENFELKPNHVIEWHQHGHAHPKENVWAATIKSVVRDFELN